jgi:predicted RNase H-like HicB family nuclease
MNKKKTEIRMRYRVHLKKTDEGYAVWVPGLPGCWSQGKTEEEALDNIKDAIKAYLRTAEELCYFPPLSRAFQLRSAFQSIR